MTGNWSSIHTRKFEVHVPGWNQHWLDYMESVVQSLNACMEGPCYFSLKLITHSLFIISSVFEGTSTAGKNVADKWHWPLKAVLFLVFILASDDETSIPWRHHCLPSNLLSSIHTTINRTFTLKTPTVIWVICMIKSKNIWTKNVTEASLEALEGRWHGISIRSTWDGLRVTTKQGCPHQAVQLCPSPKLPFLCIRAPSCSGCPRDPDIATAMRQVSHAGSSGAQVARKTTWNRRSLCLGLQNAQKRNWEHWFSWTWNRPLHHSRLRQKATNIFSWNRINMGVSSLPSFPG